MKKIISAMLILNLTPAALSMDMVEEGVVLNQELQYLVESSKVPAVRTATAKPTPDANRPENARSLEETYFGDGEDDTVSTRFSGQRRRTAED